LLIDTGKPRKTCVEVAVRRTFGILTSSQQYGDKYYLGDKIKKNEMGRAFGMYAGEERCIQGFGGET